jgi:large subunit ribosomal protein L18
VSAKLSKIESRRRRQLRLRQKVRGTADRPRLSVYKSLNHIYAQVINDEIGHTIVAASTRESTIATGLEATGNIAAAKAVGAALGTRAIEKGISSVVFDRGGWPYWGKIQALADAAREAGLQF